MLDLKRKKTISLCKGQFKSFNNYGTLDNKISWKKSFEQVYVFCKAY